MDVPHDDVELGVEQRNLHMRNSRENHHVSSVTSLSDDSGFSGLPQTTSSSISSGDSSRLGQCKFEFDLVESDGEFDSLDNCSDGGMSAENFNTLKKGPLAPIDPPPEFQDSPQTTLLRSPIIQDFATNLTEDIISEAAAACSKIQITEEPEPIFSDYYAQFDTLKKPMKSLTERIKVTPQIYASDTVLNSYDYSEDNIYDEPNGELLTSSTSDMEACNTAGFYHVLAQRRKSGLESPECSTHHLRVVSTPCGSCYRRKTPPKSTLYSPLHHTGSNLSTGNRPNSRNSLTSRLSSSHNSLSMSASNKADDSSFITQAMSHDALTGREIADFYNVPIDSDVYALPIDMVRPDKADKACGKSRNRLKYVRNNKKRRKGADDKGRSTSKASKAIDKRHSVPENCIQPESKRLFHTLYANSSDSSETTMRKPRGIPWGRMKCSETSVQLSGHSQVLSGNPPGSGKASQSTSTVKSTSSAKKASSENMLNSNNITTKKFSAHQHKKPQFSIHLNLKQKFCSIFRFRKSQQPQQKQTNIRNIHNNNHGENWDYESQQPKGESKKKIILRALPPLPGRDSTDASKTAVTDTGNVSEEETSIDDGLVKMDFTSSIEKIKQYGWYWGPISSEAAERILSNEPDGSFIVRDSSDDHYIFSLTFKLNGYVRHVRIEQDQGTFSFGSYAKFKSRTIVEFIEKAVEHSRSGRYLFFLHRRPEHGPMRVQLTNPVSRFKHVQSLQHMCRFVILKAVVRKDLIQTLPLPRRIIDYLSYKNVYSEQIESDSSTSQASNGRQS